MMKRLLFILGLFIYFSSKSQTYNPSIAGTTSNKPYAPNAAAPTDSRSYFYDQTFFTWRPYQNTSEVLTYLNLPKYRTGQFDIVVNFGGILSGGNITGGVNSIYYFKNGTADSNLVVKISTSIDTSLFLRKANNLSDLSNATTARANLGLGPMAVLTSTASGDLTGTWPNITVAKFNGLLPSYYSDYNNLTNQPTIPAQFNPIAGANITLSGTYPNITFSATTSGGGGGACLNCNADSLLKFPFDSTGLRNGYALTIDSINHKIILSPNGTGTGITQLTGDGTAGPGSGSQIFTLATVNSNVGSFGTANQVSQVTYNGKGLATAAANIPIQISEGQVTNLTTDLSGKQGNLSNTGTGFRWFVPGTSMRTFFCAGCVLDSTTNSGALTLTTTAISDSGIVSGFGIGVNRSSASYRQVFADTTSTPSGLSSYYLRKSDSTQNTGFSTVYQASLRNIKPVFLGNLYVKNNWANTSDFTAVGTPTFAASGGKLTISGGNQQPSATVGTNNAAYNQVERITAYGGTMLERWQMVDSIVINNTPGTTTYGQGIGQYSISAGGLSSAIGYFNASTNTGTGTVSLLLGSGNTTAAISPTALTFSNGDTIVLIVERIQDRITVSARNIHTNSALVTCSYTWDQSSASNILTPNTGNFAIINFGGSYIHNSISITSLEVKGANFLFAGDSKFAGYSTPWDMRIASLWNRQFPGTIVSSGEGDRTSDLLNHMNEIISLAPKTVILCIGRNDVANGVAISTVQSNLRNIANQLSAANIPYLTFDAIYETAASQTSLINSIDTMLVFQGKEVKVFAPGNFFGTVASDGIHPSYLGAELVTDVLRTNLMTTDNGKYLNDKFPIRTQVPSYDSLVLFGTINMANKPTTNNLGPYIPAARNPGDILMAAGNAISSSYGLPTQQNSFVVADAGGAQMRFIARTGGLLNNPIINFYTAGSTTGSANLNLSITEGGAIMTGAGTTANTVALMNRGDIIVGANAAIKSGSSNDGKHENQIVLDTIAGPTTFGSMLFRNYDSLGKYIFFQAKNVPGTQTQVMTLGSFGGLLLGGTTEDTSAIFNMTSTAKGFLPPRMTLAQFTAITAKATSLHAVLTDSSGRLALYDGSKIVTYATTDMLGGAAVPGGANTQIQFNNSGAFGGSASLTWSGTVLTSANMAITTLTSAGANDSVLMWNPSTKQLEMKNAALNLFAANGATFAGGDSLYGFSGVLNQNSTVQGGSFSLTMGTTGSKISTLTFNTTSGSIFQNGGVDIGGTSVTSGRLFTLEGNTSLSATSSHPGFLLNTQPGTNNDGTTSGSSSFGMYMASFNQATLTSTSAATYPEAVTLYVNGAPIASTNVTITNNYAFKVGAGNSYFNGSINSSSNTSITFSHFMSNSGTPAIAGGSGAGSSPTVSIIGNDAAGDVTITTGTSPSTSATVATITYILAFPTHSYPILTPANSNAALLSGVTSVFTTGSTTTFVITSGTTGLTAATTYVWHYQVFGD